MAIDADRVVGDILWQDQDRMSGEPCFYGTRIPVRQFLDHLESGGTIEEFLGDFPHVRQTQIRALLREGVEAVISRLAPAA